VGMVFRVWTDWQSAFKPETVLAWHRKLGYARKHKKPARMFRAGDAVEPATSKLGKLARVLKFIFRLTAHENWHVVSRYRRYICSWLDPQAASLHHKEPRVGHISLRCKYLFQQHLLCNRILPWAQVLYQSLTAMFQ
jgi:hypothetical protein